MYIFINIAVEVYNFNSGNKMSLQEHVVVAIVMDSEYLGFAFSTLYDYRLNPLKRIGSITWNDGQYSISSRTPTTLLLKPDTSFKSFGYEAEEDYLELSECSKDISASYYYFSRFTNHHVRSKCKTYTMYRQKSDICHTCLKKA